MYILLSYTALFALWLPSQRDYMLSALAALLLILFALNCPYAKIAGQKENTGCTLAAVVVSTVLDWRFVSGWLPSQKMQKIAGMMKLPTGVFLALLGTGLAVTGFFAVRQLTVALCKSFGIKDTPTQQTLKRFCNIDLLKMLAAALIVLHRYQQSFVIRFSRINFFGGQIEVAWLVELFFMISGFLMVASDKGRDISYGKQFLSKCLRFYPSVWMSLIAVLLLLAVAEPDRLHDLSVLMLLANFFLFFSGWKLDVGLGLNNPTWYLCVLILCYVLYYLVRALCRKCRLSVMPAYFLVGFASIYFMWLDVPLVNYATLRGYSCFFTGAFLYCAVSEVETKKQLIFGLGLLALSAVGLADNLKDWNIFVQALYPAVILLAVALPQIQSKTVSELGKSSFQLYIWHGPLLYFAQHFFPNYGWNRPALMIVFLLVAELFAYGAYRLFEIPTSRFIQKKLR